MLRSFHGLLLFLALGASPGWSQVFVFELRGAQEVPPAASAATGGCHGRLDAPAGTFALTCVHDVVGATVTHIHRAPAGENGPVVFDLGDPASPVTATWTGMTPGDVADLLGGNLYLNIHTDGRPAGEIRGQILPRTVDTVSFTADGGQVVPPNATEATASCVADLNDAATQIAVQCTHDLPQPQAAHLHAAPAGASGPVAFSFGSAASPLAGVVPAGPELVARFAAALLYLDIHAEAPSEEVPGATIRGQVGVTPNPTVGTIRIAKSTFPPGASGFGFAHDIGDLGGFVLDDGDIESFVDVAPGTYTVTEDLSESGFAVTDVACDDDDSTGDPFTRAATVRLEAGETVTCRFVSFLRSKAGQTLVFGLAGAQEVPPVASVHTGGCMGQLDTAAGALSLVCTHNVAAATVMHIHRGAPGATGPIVFDLGRPESPVHATWSGMTPADVADLLAGNLYLNIHTAGRPEGEIRGQIVERSVDVVDFGADAGQVVPPGAGSATASCHADLNPPATELAVQCTHGVPQPDAAHVHSAPAGSNGPAVFTFDSAASPFAADVPLSPRLVADFAALFLYVDIHSQDGPEGEPSDDIRGQIGDPPTVATGTIRIANATVPAGGSGFALAHDIGTPGNLLMSHGEVRIFPGVAPGTYTVTEADPGVTPGGYALTELVCDDPGSTADPFSRTATIRLEAGETVTCTFTNTRTAGADRTFVFHLSAGQEVPPVAGTATGGCLGQLDSAARALTLTCTHNVQDPTVMHIHRAPAGENGEVAFDLGSPTSPVQAHWTGMTPADVADLLAGRLYVNIHTGGRPNGAIRGQILPRTVDAFSFGADAGQTVPPGTSSATGSCFADLGDAATTLRVGCRHGLARPAAAHLHGAPAGENGPLVFAFGSGASPFAADVPMTPTLVADFAAGFLYVDVHSEGEEGDSEGDIRGQLVPGGVQSPIAVPTASQWSLVLLALGLLAAGWWRLRG